MFAKVFERRDDKTREWNRLIDRYIALHKYLKEVGRIGISQASSGRTIKDDVQIKLGDALNQTEAALDQLKEFFRPRIPLGTVNDPSFEVQARQLRQELEVHERERLSFLEERARLREELSRVQGITGSSSEDADGGFQARKKQRKLEETLKVQNDLIDDLKSQLFSCNRERELFRGLNTELEQEFEKMKQDEPADKQATVDWLLLKLEEYEVRLQDERQEWSQKEQRFHEERARYGQQLEELGNALDARNQEVEVLRRENYKLEALHQNEKKLKGQVEDLGRLLAGANYNADVLRFQNDSLREQHRNQLEMMERLRYGQQAGQGSGRKLSLGSSRADV